MRRSSAYARKGRNHDSGAARLDGVAAAPPGVRARLDRGADPNLSVQGDGNPLIMAREGHVEIVTLLLDRGAMIDEIVPEDENPLIQASAEGRLETVKLLLARGANVNARAWSASSPRGTGGEWRTPLSVARRGGHDAVIRYLQSKGASE
jgi:ankyrin repeat protein